ncbi:hypothetical protein I4U23_000457 [Adineta vaga]|nr:hypothetical protein I4U23_000457 [Adineta vaga]
MLKTYTQYKLNNQTILEEHIDENYEPTDEELHEYATYIGIDPEKESELLWLAKEGLMKPLPSGWKACQEENGELYYFNFDTGKSSWDHPYDDIYKARVIQAREKKSLATIMIDSHSKGKNTLSISELSSEKNLSNGKNEASDHHDDSPDIHHSESDIELNNSGSDIEHNSNDFQKDVDFGIDRQLSARIDHEQNEPFGLPTTSTVNTSENNINRVRIANLAAQAAERRLSVNKLITEENILITPREDFEVTKLRQRLEQSANEEKLQLLEDNRVSMEKFKSDLQIKKEQDERTFREQIKSELKLTEENLRENLEKEKKLLMNRQQNELKLVKQTIEKEKQELQTKLRADMLADLNLQQQDNVNIQIRLLQIKHEYEEKLRNAENRYKNEIEDLTRRYEKMKIDKDTFEKRLKEKNEFCLTIQRTIDQLRGEKSSLERKLQDTELELKTMDISHPQKSFSIHLDNDDNSHIDRTSNNVQTMSQNDDDDDEGLSDTDSDMIEMKETLKALKQMSFLPTPTKLMSTNYTKPRPKSSTIDLIDLKKQDMNPMIQNISFERTSNSSLIDSGRWSNTMPTKITNNTYPIGIQTLQHSPSLSKTNYWQSQPSLITRESVLKAARDVLPPGVIDHLTSTH